MDRGMNPMRFVTIFLRPMTGFSRTLSAAALVAAVLITGGCKEFNARRKVNDAAKLYDKGQFREAAELYEEALAEVPDLEVAHFNAGLTYRSMFQVAQSEPDATDAERMDYANKATEHFLAYLEKQPDDAKVVALTTKIWIDSGQYPKAIDYWETRRAKEPANVEVLGILASIHRQAGDWERAVEMHHLQADAQPTVDGAASTLIDIGKIIWYKLADRQKVVGLERVRIADMGIAAMQKGEKLLQAAPDPTVKKELATRLKHKVDIATYTASFFTLRGLAHPASWARGIEDAASQVARSSWQTLNDQYKKIKAEVEAEEEAAAVEAAEAGGEGS